MLPPGHEYPFAGGLPEPQPKRHRLTGEVVRQPTEGFHLGFLDDVGRVYSGSHFPGQAGGDQPVQIRPVPIE
jgi:hypothetical protein